MVFQLVVTIFLVFIIAVDAGPLDPRIVGGKIVGTTKLLPYIVSIRTTANEHFCSGAIISRYHIVTAASCFDEPQRSKAQDLWIYYDTTKSNGNEGNSALVKKLRKHPDYNSKMDLNDIAVLTVEKSFFEWNKKFTLFTSDDIMRVKIGSSSVGQEVVVGGWGSTEDSNFSTHLKQLTYKVVDNDPKHECYANNFFFCAIDLRNGTVCHGDEGGPVIADISGKRPVLVGIVPSIGEKCIYGVPREFTRIDNYKSWIMKEIGYPERFTIWFLDRLGNLMERFGL